MSHLFSAGIAAKQAAANNRTAWCQHAITDLGATRTVEFKLFTTAPSNWETGWAGLGTTFYAAPLTGTMEIVNGVITKLGKVGIPTVVANAVLAGAFAVMRVSGGGQWMQCTVGLAASNGYDGRPVSVVLRRSPNGTYGLVVNSARFAAPLSLPLTPDVELYRMTVENPTASPQAAGEVTQTFGAFFEQGEIPAGTYPHFRTVGGQACPSTQYGHVRWPDGSLRFMGAAMVLPVALAAGASMEVVVHSGGDAPVASSRSIADVASLNLNVLLTGVTTLTGNWTADLNDAAATASKVVKIADGGAGAIFRVQGELKQSGTAHAQLNCYHYVQVLQNAAGQHAGTRYLGRVGLPWADVASPAPEGMAVTMALRSGTTLRRQVQGKNAAGVVGDTMLLPHYGSIATPAVDAKYDFFPAAQAAECKARIRPASRKAMRAKIIPSMDMSITPTAPASVDFVNHGNGSMIYNTSNTGERVEIGLLPAWAAKYIIGGSEASERELRVNAMLTTAWMIGVRRKSTGEVVATADAPRTYAGLGPNQPTWRYWGSASNFSGFIAPVNNTTLWIQEYDVHHRGDPLYSAYVFTAEPQYMDLIMERSANFISIQPQGNGCIWNLVDPMTAARSGAFHSRDVVFAGTTYPGAGIFFRDDLHRFIAWGLRDLIEGSVIYPDVCPYGTEVKQYLRDVANSNLNAFVYYRNQMPAAYRNLGLLRLRNGADTNEAPWCQGYLANTLAQAAELLGTPAALECAQHMANYWISIKNDPNLDFGAGMAYESLTYGADGYRINEVTKQAFGLHTSTSTWDATAHTVSFNYSFGFANGDILCVPDATYVEGAPARSFVYVINKSGRTCQVSLTPGGAPANILQSRTKTSLKARIKDLSPDTSYELAYTTQAYIANIAGALKHLKAAGCTGLDAAIAEANTRVAARALPFADNPKNCFVAAIPSEA